MVDGLLEKWREASQVVILTGAGLSTASGIPDFRSPGGRWENYEPVTVQQFLAGPEAQAEYWRYKGETWQVIRAAEPNPAHYALSALAKRRRISTLVTQNVDGLHERAGFPAGRLVNIHGTDSEVECLRCGAREPRKAAQHAWESGIKIPRCACGGAWKPAVISFGQSLVAHDLERAFEAAENCDLFLAVGTSLVVGPINQMFSIAHRAGAATAILTRSPTDFDGLADWKFKDPVEEILPSLAENLVVGKSQRIT